MRPGRRPAGRGPERRRPPPLRGLGAEAPVRIRAEVAAYLARDIHPNRTFPGIPG